MDEKDRVFANFKDDKPDAPDRRELLTIPRRAGVPGSRAVEVVRVRSGGAVKAGPRRLDPQVRAASWDEGFPAKQAIVAPVFVKPAIAEATVPTAHVMPAWEPAAPAAASSPPPVPAPAPQVRGRRRPGRPPQAVAIAPVRRVADPFDASDDRANCMRCGYAIELTREKRGLMTCSECG